MAAATGIPDREAFGDPQSLPLNKLVAYVDQLHKARRAGEHHDIRIGDKELFSWSGRHGVPTPGEKRLLFQQPLHSKEYADFEGEIPEGYGAGTVSLHDRGTAVVTEATPDKIKFVVAHHKNPEYFTLIKSKGANRPWLMINSTPKTPEDVMAPGKFSKMHIKSVPPEKAQEFFNGLVEGKVDGASGLFKLKKDSVDVMSYRVGKGGKPIIHTERFFRGGSPKLDVPKEWVGKVLRGEIYGVDKSGKPVSPQKTSPLLNMSLENSIKAQEKEGLGLRSALFGIAGENPSDPERTKKLQEALKFLPADYFNRPPTATTPEEAKKLWSEIAAGKHPEIDEGVVAYPQDKPPVKIKLRPEYDVEISDVFPGEGKYKGSAGGIVYGDGGRVGTGFDDRYRQWLWDNRNAIKGRIAKITATKKLPSGKYFQPSFMSLHEDYPTKSAETLFTPDYTPAQLKEMGVYHEVYGPAGTPRLASLSKWPEHWYHKEDPWGWLQWYNRYGNGRRIDDDARQIKRWSAFKARHGGKAFQENPTPRRAYALRNWGIDPVKLLNNEEKKVKLIEAMENYRNQQYKKIGLASILDKSAQLYKKSTVEEDNTARPNELTPLAASAGMAALPFTSQVGANNFQHRNKGELVERLKDLKKHIRAGDIVISGGKDMTPAKFIISLPTGNPKGYHVSVAAKNRGLDTFESHPVYGFSLSRGLTDRGQHDNIQILRAKDPTHAKRILEGSRNFNRGATNFENAAIRELRRRGYSSREALENAEYLRSLLYRNNQGVAAGVKDLFLPKAESRKTIESGEELKKFLKDIADFNKNYRSHARNAAAIYDELKKKSLEAEKTNLWHKLKTKLWENSPGYQDFVKKYEQWLPFVDLTPGIGVPKAELQKLFGSCAGGVCSNVPAALGRKQIVPGKKLTDILPSDYLKSPEFTPIARYEGGKPITHSGRIANYILTHAPTFARAGVGVGLGASTYIALKKYLAAKQKREEASTV